MEKQNPKLLNKKERFSLFTQRFVGWATMPFWNNMAVILMRFWAKYHVPDLRNIRKQFKQMLKDADGPIIVCANHLTKIDSVLINWSLASWWTYMKHYRSFSWNMPERANFASNPVLRGICYLASCIPVDRGGDRDIVKKSIDKITHMMHKGHTVTIFPEGKRSRIGKIDADDYSYGVGRLVKTVQNAKVLCVYLRGEAQETFSSIPKRGQKFYLDMKLIAPESPFKGLRATKDISEQVIQQLTAMEERYFTYSPQPAQA